MSLWISIQRHRSISPPPHGNSFLCTFSSSFSSSGPDLRRTSTGNLALRLPIILRLLFLNYATNTNRKVLLFVCPGITEFSFLDFDALNWSPGVSLYKARSLAKYSLMMNGLFKCFTAVATIVVLIGSLVAPTQTLSFDRFDHEALAPCRRIVKLKAGVSKSGLLSQLQRNGGNITHNWSIINAIAGSLLNLLFRNEDITLRIRRIPSPHVGRSPHKSRCWVYRRRWHCQSFRCTVRVPL